MTGTRSRAWALVVAGGLLVGATACTPAPSGTPTPTSPPSPSASASASPTVQITFDDGDLLDPSQRAAWADPLATTEGYTVLTADDGDGSWSYRSEATQCVIGYWSGPLPGAEGGDSALSDELLAAQFGTTAEDVAGFVQDDVAPFRTPSELVQTRAVAGADSETATTYLVSARAFSALGEGFVATLRCPASMNVQAVWALLSSDPDAFELVFSNGG